MARQHQQVAALDDDLIQADSYIDSLLRRPLAPLATTDLPADAQVRRAIELLAGLPRFSPPFAFQEMLAARLRGAAGPAAELAEVIRLPLPAQQSFAGIDRRLIVGGAIASGVSLVGAAGLAAFAWLRRDGRDAREGRSGRSA
jgi:hypothetical protein